ncbi:hypothetical protein B0F90DRAFT_1820059 [Multifurca ochricompacta]|uniref:DUF6535 domain-containing protein n=1 Tax=Multifurca ochricompacta TaxID=376703 RepID=A0AAD4LZ29_9AGAM|nr:hypothetical protein B0F90DRAFT_1820059 [Multifurca ochricompacta]
MDGILVFTGVIFSAALAAILIVSYQEALTRLWGPISLQSTALDKIQNFEPPASAVRVNILWFLSLLLSLACALSATLMQQWSRRYQQLVHRYHTPHQQGRVRAYLFGGMQQSRIIFVVDVMTAVLHASVWLFLVGLYDFLRPINKSLVFVVLGVKIPFAIVYSVITIAPNIYFDFPYNTPLSSGIWRISQALAVLFCKVLKSCLAQDDSAMTTETRRRRLLISIRAVWSCAKACNDSGANDVASDYVHTLKVITRCICALLAARLNRNIRHPIKSGELHSIYKDLVKLLPRFLQSPDDVNPIFVDHPELVNIVSLLRVLTGKKLPRKVLSIISETFATLARDIPGLTGVPQEVKELARSVLTAFLVLKIFKKN